MDSSVKKSPAKASNVQNHGRPCVEFISVMPT